MVSKQRGSQIDEKSFRTGLLGLWDAYLYRCRLMKKIKKAPRFFACIVEVKDGQPHLDLLINELTLIDVENAIVALHEQVRGANQALHNAQNIINNN